MNPIKRLNGDIQYLINKLIRPATGLAIYLFFGIPNSQEVTLILSFNSLN